MQVQVEVLGLIAGACSTFSTIPQIYKVWQRRSAADISLTMFILWWVGAALWIVYGVIAGTIALIIANIISCILVTCVIIMKLKFD